MGRFLARHALLLIVLGGAVIRFATLGSQGYWIDEHSGINTIVQQKEDLLRALMGSETQPVGYLVAAKAWKTVFGVGEVGLRSLSALAGTATIPVVYAAARALGSRRTALFAAALTAASPLMIWYSQEARPYALFAFFSALAFWFFLEALRGRNERWLWAWGIVSVLAFSTHYFGFVSAGIEAVWLFYRLRDRRVDVALTAGLLAAAAIPLVLLGLAQQHFTGWIDDFSAIDRILLLPQHLVVGMSSPWDALPPLGIALVVVVIAYAAITVEPRTLRAAALPAGIALAAVVAVLLAMAAGTDLLTTRNMLGIWAPIAIAVALLLAAPAMRIVGTATVILLCVGGAALAVWTAATPAAGRPDFEPLVEELGPAEVPRAVVYDSAFVAPLVRDLPGGFEPAPGASASVQEIDQIEIRPVTDYSVGPCSWLGVCTEGIETAELEFPPLPRGFKLVEEGETSLFRYRRYQRERPYDLPAAPVFGNALIVQPPS